MRLIFRLLLLVCLSSVLGWMLPPAAYGQSTPAQPASPAATLQATQPSNTQQAYTLPPDKLAKAIAISRIRHILELVSDIWGLVFLWLFLVFHGASGLAGKLESLLKRRWLSGLVFFAAFFIITTLASLPLDLYGEHVSRAYGISVQGWGSWFADQAKALGLSVLFGAPVLLLFNWIVRRWPQRYWFGIWLVTVPLILLGSFISPFLEPLFNKYEPLSTNHPALVFELEKVVARTGTNIPPNRMFLMKASVKTNGLNAYVSGLGATKRVVVWDTTAGRIPDDEILFIFGHESGHYVLHHIPKELACTAVFLFFLFWACAAGTGWMLKRFGLSWHAPSVESRAGFVVLLFAISIASFITEPINNGLSRHFEHEADVYGQEAIHGIVPDAQKTAVAAFNQLGEAWLEDPHPSPIIEFWFYNHPSEQNRAEFALHYDPWANGGHGRFFDK